MKNIIICPYTGGAWRSVGRVLIQLARGPGLSPQHCMNQARRLTPVIPAPGSVTQGHPWVPESLRPAWLHEPWSLTERTQAHLAGTAALLGTSSSHLLQCWRVKSRMFCMLSKRSVLSPLPDCSGLSKLSVPSPIHSQPSWPFLFVSLLPSFPLQTVLLY